MMCFGIFGKIESWSLKVVSRVRRGSRPILDDSTRWLVKEAKKDAADAAVRKMYRAGERGMDMRLLFSTAMFIWPGSNI